jgi:hypothetical protein
LKNNQYKQMAANNNFRLNEAQMLLLQLFQHRQQMTPEELESLKDTLVGHLSQELDQEVALVMQEKGVTAADIATKTAAINQHRTSYLKKTRLEK